MTDPNKCPKCGGYKKPQFDLCYKCDQEARGASRSDRSRSFDRSLPDKCIMDTFYKGKFLRREIFLDEAQTLADMFGNDRPAMSQSSIRSLFGMLKGMEQRIKVDKKLPEDEVREVYFRFIRHCEYQRKRNVIPESFLKFAREHLSIATKNNKEFCGFVEYLTSIMARMKTK